MTARLQSDLLSQTSRALYIITPGVLLRQVKKCTYAKFPRMRSKNAFFVMGAASLCILLKCRNSERKNVKHAQETDPDLCTTNIVIDARDSK